MINKKLLTISTISLLSVFSQLTNAADKITIKSNQFSISDSKNITAQLDLNQKYQFKIAKKNKVT